MLGLGITLVFVISIYWTSARGAPWAPTSMKIVHKMLTMAEVRPGDLVYDPGCGDGRMILTAARRYGARALGIEIDPLR
jgi:cyclopropane fatty-acyl-phospholipid synthase-like methyltransferase